MKHWRIKIVYKCAKGKIVKWQNVSDIYNDVDYYVLFDAAGLFVDQSANFNYLMDHLQNKM